MELQKELLDYIGQILLTVNESISVAESVTSGFLQFSFSQMKDASAFFKGGITAYTLEEKVRLLNINEIEAKECDCVSSHIAETMAINVAKLFRTDWSIAVTGYATPVETSGFKIYSFFSFAYKNEIILSKKLEENTHTLPTQVQFNYSEFILEYFKLELDKHIDQRSESKTSY